jgi:Predicted acetyltransferase
LSLMIVSTIDSQNKDYVRDRIIAFNLMHFSDELKGRYEELSLHLVNNAGQIFGGIVGEFCWNWLEIQYLFVETEYRKSGYGKALMREAEKMARKKKCDFIKLDTLSFQALEFYLKEDFQIYGTIENAGGHTHYYLKKDIIEMIPQVDHGISQTFKRNCKVAKPN